MRTIRARLSNKSRESLLRRIRTSSSSYSYSNRTQSIIPASSRYNRSQTSSRNLNVTQEFFDEDDDVAGAEGDETNTQDNDGEMDTQDNDGDEPMEPLLSDFEEIFQNSQSKIIEERNLATSYSGDYGPYFPNATTFMLFTWCTKHMISKY
jgi:hypothetical protein